MKNTRPQPWKRALAGVLTLQLALAPLQPAFAQLTKLTDEPIGFSPSAPPNIVLTVDDSTSMLSDFLPDYVIGNFCRDATGNMTVACGFVGSATTPQYIYSQGALVAPQMPYPRYGPYSASSAGDWMRAWNAPAHNNALNRLYYDPKITYTPPLKYDGTPYANQTLMTSVVADPWAAVLKYENLTTNIQVGMWCNSDWPVNTNWNPGTGGGADCRINGTDYSGMVTNKAPADYQYPWQKTAGVNDVKYFWRGGAANTTNGWNKVIYCDATSPKWPKTTPCATSYGPGSCPVPQTYIPPAAVPQSCFDAGVKNGCTGPVTYTPAGCNTNPLYGSPGPCTGPECLVCTQNACPTGPIGRNGRCRLTSTGTGGSGANCDCAGAGCTVNPSHPACTPFTPAGAGTCSGGATPTLITTCSNAAGDCNRFLWDPVAKAPTTRTMQQDADVTNGGSGEVCRHNNQAYPDGTLALPFNYPSGKYTTAITSSCPGVPGSASVKRHYWKTSVEWCINKITANNDKWRGFGLSAAGACQDDRDAAHPYPRFYKYGVRKTDPEYLDNYTYGAFERVDLQNSALVTHTHQYYDSLGALQTIVRDGVQEMQNYANWFAYYRTRIQAAKTTISQNFTYLDDTYRVGFHTLSNNPPASFVNVNAFDVLAGGQKDLWYQQLFGIRIRMGEQTPNMEAVVRIGELFKNGTSGTLAGATDPIVLTCQKNYHMLFTDGITNQAALPAITVGNVDNIVPALPVALPLAAPPIVAGSPWPELYRENTAASLANTMGDYAMHYWVTDLRPGMVNNVIVGRDPAPWQHLNFAALSLGTEGTLSGAQPVVEAQITAGTLEWPTPTPSQFKPNATGVDDLWHAAINARGRFVNAKTSQQLGRGIAAILADITSPSGSAAPPTFANPNISVTNKYTYISKFEQGWGGNVQKVEINPVSLATVGVIWDAAAQLTAQTTPTVPDPAPWFTKRRIVTLNEAGAAVPFLHANLGPTQQSTLGPSATYQQDVIEYLRGNRAKEGDLDGQFRIRVSPLGDIVDSAGALVSATLPPDSDYWEYLEANDPGYTAYKTSQNARPARLYVGANDGMLHAFDGATGDEAWAFIPRDFYRSAPPISNDKAGLIGLTYQPGGLPIYDHRYYVNATPRIVDAKVGANWKTLLVSGMGKGGKSYFALDASDPGTVVDESSAAAKFLWEFRNADLGYTYGRATIVKTRAFGWTVVVPSGYNNTSGEGKLFFLRASDGVLLKTMSTSIGTPGNPSGLAHIAGFTKDYRDQTVEQFYGGDLFGNVWRFDVSDANDANWVVKKFAELKDGGGAPQPITTPPRIDIDINNGIDRWVFVGTGRLLHVDDLPSTQTQAMYALRDGTYDVPTPNANPALTRIDLNLVSGIAGLGPSIVAAKGWYDEFPAGERIIRTPVAAVGLIAYISTSQPIDPCEVGLPANIYARQFGNGESSLEVAGVPVEFIYEPTGAAGIDVVATVPPGCTANCIPDISLVILSSSTSTLLTFKAKLPNITGQRRLSWGTLGQ